MAIDRSPDLGRRSLPVPGFIAAAFVWIALVKVVGSATSSHADVHDGRLLTVGNLVWGLVIPLGVGVVFIYVLIAYLGWWRPLLYDPRPVQRWVWVIAAVFALAELAGINYGGLGDRGIGFTVTLLVVAMLIGFGEEGLFRCIGVTALRQHGMSEAKVALWSSVIFGLAHVANLIGGDAKALAQAVIVSFAGYFFYLIRRVSRSNIANSILHGMFDFTILTATQIIPPGHDAYTLGAALPILVYLVCGITLLLRRHHIEPTPTT